jgi:hypothetical protein
MIRALSRTLYGLFAGIYLVAGLSVLALGTGILPGAVRDVILGIGQGDGNTLHIMQEFGSLLVFTGLMTLWFIRNYDQSLPFHWAMTGFWGLFALVHWFDIRGSFRSAVGPMINTIPLALFGAVGLLRQRAERPGHDRSRAREG